MSRKVIVAALLLITIFAPAANVLAESGAEPQAKATNAAGDSQATEAAHRVFEGSQFWWKHRTKIEDPSINLGFMAFVKRCIGAVLDFLKSVVRRIFEFLRSLMPSWVPRIPVSGATSGLKWGLAAVAIAAIGVIVYQFLKRRRLAIDSPAQPLAEPERLPDSVLLIARRRRPWKRAIPSRHYGSAFKRCSRCSRTAESCVTIRRGPTASTIGICARDPRWPLTSAAFRSRSTAPSTARSAQKLRTWNRRSSFANA